MRKSIIERITLWWECLSFFLPCLFVVGVNPYKAPLLYLIPKSIPATVYP